MRTCNSEFHILRLKPSQDVYRELTRFLAEKEVSAGALISAVGSLSDVCIRLAGATEQKSLTGRFEVTSLSGSLCQDGIHLHLTIADHDGHCLGGHLLQGCRVHTTLELVIIAFDDIRFKRPFDPETGYDELIILHSG
ncbi:DNA-binding protein [bacterium]|nr:DNA-binding protein [candidate division CSSED10-310 bacterium]